MDGTNVPTCDSLPTSLRNTRCDTRFCPDILDNEPLMSSSNSGLGSTVKRQPCKQNNADVQVTDMPNCALWNANGRPRQVHRAMAIATCTLMLGSVP
eukprot:6452462-Amphidinium_carterae.1